MLPNREEWDIQALQEIIKTDMDLMLLRHRHCLGALYVVTHLILIETCGVFTFIFLNLHLKKLRICNDR